MAVMNGSEEVEVGNPLRGRRTTVDELIYGIVDLYNVYGCDGTFLRDEDKQAFEREAREFINKIFG